MRLDHVDRSENVEDRRGIRPAVAVGGMGILGIILMLILTGGDFGKVFNMVLQQKLQQPQQQQGPVVDPEDPQQKEWADLVSKVLKTTEEVWTEELPQLPANMARNYVKPKLVMFTGTVQSGCGFAQAQMGPFYCPADQQVYIDLTFFNDMKDKMGASGDFAQAYVVAHEVGHHVQNLIGLSEEVQRRQQMASSKEEANQYSVRLELQADYLAGVWANRAQQDFGILEEGDVEEGIVAALAIGDDRLQKQSQGYIVPENFTHGTSDQRRRWFMEGMKTGDASRMMELFERPYNEL